MKTWIHILFGGLCIQGFSQGLINNGAYLVLAGPAQVYINGSAGHFTNQAAGQITPSASGTISVAGNWINNSSPANTVFNTDGGGVVLLGAAQSIGGSSPTSFYNLSLAGSGVKSLAVNQNTVGGQSSFGGILSLGSSTLDLNANTLNVTNSAAGAITRSSGYIISETPSASNPSFIRWYHRTTTGSKVYPFGVSGAYIPFTFNISSAMSNAAAYVEVSTRATAASDNLPWASGVTHMYSPNVPYANGSVPAVVDRWWQVNNSHAVTADATFSYRGIENTLNPLYNNGLIGAQYWAGGWLPNNSNIGSAAAVTSGVGSVTASGLSAFGPWVLSSRLSPLPLELLSFSGTCSGTDIVLSWCTASESGNDYFLVEQSLDGVNFTSVAQVPGAGTSSEKHCYQYKAKSLSEGLNYFRIHENGPQARAETSAIIPVSACDAVQESIRITSDGSREFGLIVNTDADQTLQLFIHNTLGQVIDTRNIHVDKGYQQVRLDAGQLSESVYYVSVFSAGQPLITKKIVVSGLGR